MENIEDIFAAGEEDAVSAAEAPGAEEAAAEKAAEETKGESGAESTGDAAQQKAEETGGEDTALQLTAEQLQHLAVRGGFAPKAAPEKEEFSSFAKKLGVAEEDVPSAMAEILENQRRMQGEREVQGLLEKGFDEETARRYVQLQQEEKQRKEQEKREAAIAEAEKQKNAEMDAEVRLFKEMFPDVKELPEEDREAINKGFGLIEAHLLSENRKLRAQLQGLRKNAENKQKAVGSAQGNAEGDAEDAFEKGFDKAFQF